MLWDVYSDHTASNRWPLWDGRSGHKVAKRQLWDGQEMLGDGCNGYKVAGRGP